MKSKHLAFLAVLAVSTLSYGMEVEEESSIIKDASYVIDGADWFRFQDNPPAPGFYTATGELIQTATGELIQVVEDQQDLKKWLDPQASKPQPISYKFKYWPAVSIGWGMTKGVPGDFVVFYDKNGNVIESHRYNSSTDEVTIFSDVTLAKQVPFTQFDELDMTVAKNETTPKDLEHPQQQGGCSIQ